MSDFDDIIDVLDASIEVCSAREVSQAITRLASEITKELADTNPIVMCVLNGGMVFTGQLLPMLHFPLELDYLHASRYRRELEGADLEWIARPQQDLSGRTILILDDIFDQGFTLDAIARYCKSAGASKVYTAVLVEKHHERPTAPLKPDFVGLVTRDLYLFGAGMDYLGYWRNLPCIYGLKA